MTDGSRKRRRKRGPGEPESSPDALGAVTSLGEFDSSPDVLAGLGRDGSSPDALAGVRDAGSSPDALAGLGAGDGARSRAELEIELRAARRTIDVLIAKSERRSHAPSQAELFEAAARMEQLVELRTRELALGQAELERLSTTLDQTIRLRTRALTESEEELKRKNAELERQTAAKSEFIAIIAHELRTPMVSIVGYLDLLVEGRFGAVSPAMERPVTSLRRNAHRLRRLIDEMLDFARLGAGKVRLQRVPVALGAVVEDALAELTPLAIARQHQMRAAVEPIRPIDADPEKLHRVVINLVSNAIRYTPPSGSIVVLVDDAPAEVYPGDWARLRVRDNGIGIPAAHRHRIFEPFTDVKAAKHHTSSVPDSAGLGLFIARGLVELHGGLITVESTEGAGSEFTVLMPR
jgi:signal transduction histidine kinase